MAASGKRMRALRKREHRGSVTFTIAISEDDLRAIARHGYEGAASADQAQCVQALNSSSPTCSPPRSAKITALRRSQRRSVTQ
jgi:hypothetical protein